MPAGVRKKRVAEQLLEFIAFQLRRMGDPRFEWLTLTDIDMSPDLKTAWIYYSVISSGLTQPPPLPAGQAPEAGDLPENPASVFPKPEEIRSIEQALHGVTPILKRGIGEQLRLRYTPSLVFKYDSSSATGSRIEQLLREAKRTTTTEGGGR